MQDPAGFVWLVVPASALGLGGRLLDGYNAAVTAGRRLRCGRPAGGSAAAPPATSAPAS
jgi:hypothetical protein